MAEVRIAAEARTEFGKGGARRTRRAGRIPAVLYGHGTPPRHISLPAREFAHALRGDAGLNVLLRLDLDGDSELALPKAVQRDPVRGAIEHADLLLVRRGERVTVEVAVQLTGEIVAEGLADQQLTTLSVSAEATHIPQHFEVDLTDRPVGSSVHAKEVALPEGVELQADPEAVVVNITAKPTAAELEADLSAAEAELGAGATGAAAQAAAQQAEEGEAAQGETGEGDIVPDSDSAEGGPSAGQTPGE